MYYDYILENSTPELLKRVGALSSHYDNGNWRRLLQPGRVGRELKALGLRLSQIGGHDECVAALFLLFGMVESRRGATEVQPEAVTEVQPEAVAELAFMAAEPKRGPGRPRRVN